jgi:hypothetical protein
LIYKILVGEYGTDVSYQLYQLLLVYDSPDDVLVQGWPYNEEHVPHYALLLVYRDQGILVRYQGDAQFTANQNMMICPKDIGPELTLWNPERKDNSSFIDDLLEHHNNLWIALEFQPIQDVTEMGVEVFNETMKDPNACFETPIELWIDE